MERKIYNKLVRDKIPEILEKDGQKPNFRILDEAEYKKFLRLKLVEEAGEVNAAKSRDDLLKELADVLEVFEAVMKNADVSQEEVDTIKNQRRQDRGGFLKRIYLISA